MALWERQGGSRNSQHEGGPGCTFLLLVIWGPRSPGDPKQETVNWSHKTSTLSYGQWAQERKWGKADTNNDAICTASPHHGYDWRGPVGTLIGGWLKWHCWVGCGHWASWLHPGQEQKHWTGRQETVRFLLCYWQDTWPKSRTFPLWVSISLLVKLRAKHGCTLKTMYQVKGASHQGRHITWFHP